MSGYDAGSLFVRIVPTADGFGQTAAAEIRKQAPAVQQAAQAALGSPQQVSGVTGAFRKYQDEFAKTAKALEAAQATSARSLIGQASTAEATAALEAYTAQALLAARADVELSLASGVATDTFASSITLLKEEQVALQANTAATRENAHAGEQAHAQRFRQQARRVAEGEAPISSLLGPSSLLKFGAGALAFGAVITSIQHAEEALKVTGDEAFTTEGKLRNLGATILSGDVVGAFEALNAHAASARTQLNALLADPKTRGGDLAAFGQEAGKAATGLEQAAAASKALGQEDSALGSALARGAVETRNAANEALALARAFETSASAANDVSAAIQAAGSDVAAFGERTRGAGAVAAEGGRPRGAPSNVDTTATAVTANAVAAALAARTKSLTDDLALARREAAQSAQLERNLGDVAEGAAARHQATVEANTRVVQVQQQIDANAAQAAQQATAARKRSAQEAKSARDEAARLAAEEARAAAAAAKAEIDRRLALDDLRIEQTGLSKGLGDDRKAINAKIDDLKALRSKTKQYSAEWVAYSRDITGLRLTLQNLGSNARSTAAGGGGFSLQDAFTEAGNQFATFGSNIGRRDAILSRQDARAGLGLQINQDLASQIQGAQLTTQQQMAASLASIDAKLSRDAPSAQRKQLETERYATIQGLRGAAMAAAYGFGAN